MSENNNSESIIVENEPKYERFSERNIEYHSNEQEPSEGEIPEKAWKKKFKASMRDFKEDVKKAAQDVKKFAQESAATMRKEAHKFKKSETTQKPVNSDKSEAPPIMFCPNCGYSVKPNEKRKFCPSCGKSF